MAISDYLLCYNPKNSYYSNRGIKKITTFVSANGAA